LVWSRATALPPFAASADDAAPQPSHAVAELLTFAGGGAAAVMQVVWVRVFSIALRGTVYGVGSVLICILVAMALGSLFVSRVLRTTAKPVAWFVGLQLGTVIGVGVLCAALPRIAWLLEEVPFGPAAGAGKLHAQLALVVAVLLVPAFCSGASFPLLVRIVERRAPGVSRTFGRLYAANTVGSILGFLLGGFWLLPQLGSSIALAIAVVVTAGIAAVAAFLPGEGAGRGLRIGLVGAAGVATLLVPGIDVRTLATPPDPLASFEQTSVRRDRGAAELLYFDEGIASTVAVYERDGERALALNGMGQGRLRREEPRHALESLLVALTPLAHRDLAERVLVVGLGAGVTVDALLQLGVGAVDVVELEPKVVDAARHPRTANRRRGRRPWRLGGHAGLDRDLGRRGAGAHPRPGRARGEPDRLDSDRGRRDDGRPTASPATGHRG
jgi:predicted membrane-bound spermidine synthase